MGPWQHWHHHKWQLSSCIAPGAFMQQQGLRNLWGKELLGFVSGLK